MIDGQPVAVYASFRVLFQERDGDCAVEAFPNLGTQQSEFGLNYFSPQEINTDGGWARRLPASVSFTRRLRSSPKENLQGIPLRGIAFTMSVAVDELGTASDGRVEVNNFATEGSTTIAMQALEASTFIPAIVDGEPRTARYFEFVYVR